MFNPINIDEVSIQATHHEDIKGKHGFENVSKKPHEFEKQPKGEGKSNKTTIVKIDEENPTCSHYKKKGYEEAKCWNLHPKVLPKNFKDKGKQNTIAIVQ